MHSMNYETITFPWISYVEECPRCSTVNVITRTGAASTSVEDDFVCRHCGWYEDLFIEDYVGLEREREI